MAAWPALLAAPTLAQERRVDPSRTHAPPGMATAASHRMAEPYRLRLLPPGGRVRSHRLVEAMAAAPYDDGRLRAQLRGVPLWEKSSDGTAFALGVSPVGGRVIGALRIVR